MKRRAVLLLALLAAGSVAGAATGDALPGGKWQVGVNYDPVVPAQPTAAPRGRVEVLEVFWLACPHCYALEPYLRNWLKDKPDYVDFVRVPVMWGPAHRLHAQLFYTLEALHRDDLVEKAFDTMHGGDLLLGTNEQDSFEKQLDWAKSNGIDPRAFTTAYNSSVVNAQLQHAQEITDRYQVEGVPFVAVGGKYSTDVGKAGAGGCKPDDTSCAHEQLIRLIDELAAFDHQQRSHRS